MMHLTDLQWQALASGGGLPRISLTPPPPSPTSLRSPDPQEDKGKAEQREDPDPAVAAAEIEGPELRQPRARRRPELRKERPRRWHRNQGSAANLLPVGPSRDYSPGDLDPRRRSLRRPCSNSPAAPAPRWPFRATEIQDTPEYIWSCVVAWHGITSLELFAAIACHRQSLLLLPCWLLPPTMVLPCRRLVRVDRKGLLRKPRLLWLAEAKSLFALEGKECHQARTSLHELQMKLMRKAMHARILRNLDVCRLGAFSKKVCWSISICSGRERTLPIYIWERRRSGGHISRMVCSLACQGREPRNLGGREAAERHYGLVGLGWRKGGAMGEMARGGRKNGLITSMLASPLTHYHRAVTPMAAPPPPVTALPPHPLTWACSALTMSWAHEVLG